MAAWLMALSLPMVQYASEARGYAGAIFFSLLAWLLVERYWHSGSKLALVGFWLTSVLGVLSQLTALYVYAALVPDAERDERGTGRELRVPEEEDSGRAERVASIVGYVDFVRSVLGPDVPVAILPLPLSSSSTSGL